MKPTVIKYGVILGVIGILQLVAVYFLSDNAFSQGNWPYQLGGLVVTLVVLAVGMKEVRSVEYNNLLTFGKAFTSAYFMMIISAVVSVVFSVIWYSFVYTNWQQDLANAQFEQITKNPNITPEAADRIYDQMLNTSIIWVIVPALLIVLIVGAIIALIYAAIFKNHKEVAAD